MFPLALSLKADPMFGIPWLTNSTVYAAAVALFVVALAQLATARMRYVPAGLQNFLEFTVDGLHNLLGGIVGKHMIARAFPLLGTLFLFILVANWAALVPGVGTVGWGHSGDHGFHVTAPVVRPPNADVNMTLGMTIVFFLFWIVWVVQEQGVWGFLHHTFAPKGVQGILFALLLPVFIAVGFIELVSIGLRGISLPIRLFGNNFAGESLLHAMGGIAPAWYWNALIMVPFYFLELLIGLVQALVFTLLCAVYIRLNTSHDEGGDSH